MTMFEESPRATKRRCVGKSSEDELSATASKVRGTPKGTPRTYSKRQRAAWDLSENKENLRQTPIGEVPEAAVGSAAASFVDSAYQSQTNDEGKSAEDEADTVIASGPPKKEMRARQDNKRIESRPVDDQDEDSMADTINVAPAETRTSKRARKQTWKLSEPVVEDASTQRVKKTPTSLRRPKKTAATRALSPVVRDPFTIEITAEVDNVPVADAAATPTPTPKKRQRQTKPKKVSEPLQSEPLEPVTAVPETIDPRLISLAAAQESSVQDEPLFEPSPFKTTAPNLTPTPRKRGRPPKARVTDEFGFTAVDPLASSAKRQRKSLADDTEDIDPLSRFVRRDVSSAQKAAAAQPNIAKAKPVTWRDFGDSESAVRKRPEIPASLSVLRQLADDSALAGPLEELRNGILQALTGRRRMPFQGLDDEYQKVRQLVEQTVVAGEGNSMMIIGPRGSGKSVLLNTVLHEMSGEHTDEFHTIRLNGFIHTDDKLALREIWRQLGREMDVDDNSALERSNYADTLASLLAVLSHPSEQDQAAGSTEGTTAKSIVFVIDEFDLFTTHPRQTLLYNLFDIAQARKAPIAVLGLTTRVDVTESLEKRVKSRFSHRSVFLPRPKSFYAFQQVCLAALTAGGEVAVPPLHARADEIEYATSYRQLHAAWSDYITALFHESTALTATLRTIYATTRSIPIALSSFLLPISTLSLEHIPSDFDFASQGLLPPDSKLTLLASLTELELALVIAAARLDIILNVDTCNFNMAYDEYTQLANQSRIQKSASGARALGDGSRTWSREAALGAWEKLEILELIMPLATAGYGASAGLADVGRSGKLMRCDVSLEEIRYSGVQMGGVMLKWCKEI